MCLLNMYLVCWSKPVTYIHRNKRLEPVRMPLQRVLQELLKLHGFQVTGNTLESSKIAKNGTTAVLH